MRVAIVAPPWVPIPPPAYGGTELVLDALARGLLAAGHEVLLCTTGDSTCPVPTQWVLPEAPGVGKAGSATELRHVIHAYDAIREWGADVVHDHTLVGPVYAQRFPDLPVVTTNHGPFQSELGDYYAAIAPWTAIAAVSHHQASTAGDTPVAAVIHHGVDLDAYRPGAGSGGYALFIGRACHEKGLDTAVRVARASGVALRLAVKVQEPYERAYFDSRIAPLLGPDVDFLGEVGGDDKVKLLGDATCLLNPIRWPEPFGMVMIEALACGTPVIATPCASVPELIDDGRTGFIRADEPALAEAVRQAPLLDRTACRDAAVERFSLEQMVDSHVALYRRIAQRRELQAA